MDTSPWELQCSREYKKFLKSTPYIPTAHPCNSEPKIFFFLTLPIVTQAAYIAALPKLTWETWETW